MMRDDVQEILSSMLADWHQWSQGGGRAEGYAGKSPGFGQSRSNSQYDWANNIESDLVDRRIMQGFDAAIQRVQQPWNTALQFEARNLVARHAVWTSPRLPVDKWLREELIREARELLLKELAKDGVLC
jgi:hypothetical protein